MRYDTSPPIPYWSYGLAFTNPLDYFEFNNIHYIFCTTCALSGYYHQLLCGEHNTKGSLIISFVNYGGGNKDTSAPSGIIS